MRLVRGFKHIFATGFNPRTHVGCDYCFSRMVQQQSCFNPRTHVGCDLAELSTSLICIGFQSTHPRRVRHSGDVAVSNTRKFQSTHPRRVRLFQRLLQRLTTSFNPRTHVGCDLRAFKTPSKQMFQSTHPRRVRHVYGVQEPRRIGFNPRTHVGCDHTRY